MEIRYGSVNNKTITPNPNPKPISNNIYIDNFNVFWTLLRIKKGSKKQSKFWSDFGKKLAPGRTRVAEYARPVKAYPGGFRPGKTLGSKVSNTLITASGGRRIDHGFANTADHLCQPGLSRPARGQRKPQK